MKRKRSTRTTQETAPPLVAARTAAERALAENMLQRLRSGGDVRARKVRRIKAAIKVRHYENALKLAVAVERLSI